MDILFLFCRREIQVIRDQRRAHALHAAYQDIKADVDKVNVYPYSVCLSFYIHEPEKAYM